MRRSAVCVSSIDSPPTSARKPHRAHTLVTAVQRVHPAPTPPRFEHEHFHEHPADRRAVSPRDPRRPRYPSGAPESGRSEMREMFMTRSRYAPSRAPVRSWRVRYRRMPIEVESPEQLGYTRSRTTCPRLRRRPPVAHLGIDSMRAVKPSRSAPARYGDHLGNPSLREAVAAGGEGCAPTTARHPGAAAHCSRPPPPSSNRRPRGDRADKLRDELETPRDRRGGHIVD